MKQLLIIILAAFALTACNVKTQAQIRMYVSTTGAQSAISTSVVADTLTNADSTYFLVPTGSLNKYTGREYTFYFTLDTISGTTTPGNVVQQGSYDGVTWFNLSGGDGTFANSAFKGVPLGTDGNNCDSLTWAVANCANKVNKCYTIGGTGKYSTVYSATLWNLAPRVTYLRLKFVSSGTQSTRIYNVYCIAKP